MQRLGAKAGFELHAGADRGARHQHGGQTEYVRQRQHAVDAILAVHLAERRRDIPGEAQIRVRQHHALRRAGGPGGVENDGDLIGILDHRPVMTHVVDRQGHPSGVQGEGFRLRRVGVGGSLLGDSRGKDACSRRRMVDHAGQLGGFHAGVDRYRRGAGRRDSKDEGSRGEAVLGDDHHAIACLDSVVVQQCRRLVDGCAKVSVAHRAAIMVDHGPAVGIVFGLREDQLLDTFSLFCCHADTASFGSEAFAISGSHFRTPA